MHMCATLEALEHSRCRGQVEAVQALKCFNLGNVEVDFLKPSKHLSTWDVWILEDTQQAQISNIQNSHAKVLNCNYSTLMHATGSIISRYQHWAQVTPGWIAYAWSPRLGTCAVYSKVPPEIALSFKIFISPPQGSMIWGSRLNSREVGGHFVVFCLFCWVCYSRDQPIWTNKIFVGSYLCFHRWVTGFGRWRVLE